MDESAQVKGIFFDFDGVLTVEKKGTPTMVAYISEKTGLPYDRVETEYRKFNKDLLMGNITHKDMWEPFCRAVGQDIGYEILERSFLNMTLDRQIIKLIREYRKKYLIGMITDNKTDRIEAVIENTELKGLFDAVIISANVHAQKTDEKIFLEALKESGLRADECVFIDNSAANLVVPGKMGFRTIFFDDEKRDYTELLNF